MMLASTAAARMGRKELIEESDWRRAELMGGVGVFFWRFVSVMRRSKEGEEGEGGRERE